MHDINTFSTREKIIHPDSIVWIYCNYTIFGNKKTAEAVRKPNSVSGIDYSQPDYDHSSLGNSCPLPLATYPETRTSSPQTFPYLVLHRMGFTKLFRSPGKLVCSYHTFSPLPAEQQAQSLIDSAGGILSVALSFALPRLHVMEHPALWCSDFPPDQQS
jgi:hypothetical protein